MTPKKFQGRRKQKQPWPQLSHFPPNVTQCEQDNSILRLTYFQCFRYAKFEVFRLNSMERKITRTITRGLIFLTFSNNYRNTFQFKTNHDFQKFESTFFIPSVLGEEFNAHMIWKNAFSEMMELPISVSKFHCVDHVSLLIRLWRLVDTSSQLPRSVSLFLWYPPFLNLKNLWCEHSEYFGVNGNEWSNNDRYFLFFVDIRYTFKFTDDDNIALDSFQHKKLCYLLIRYAKSAGNSRLSSICNRV